MDTQLKQRLVGLTVIFSVAVIFLPMLLDGSGISRDPAPDSSIPPKPEIEAGLPVKELVMELDKKTEELVRLEPVIVDEISDPPVKAGSDTKQLSPAVDTKQATPAKTDAQKSEQPQKATVVNKAESKAAQKPPQKVASKPVATEKAVKPVAPKKPVEKEESKPGGLLWVVQTGSFQEKDKAYKQRDRIRKSRLAPVFIEKFEREGKLNYRVRMGPFLTRNKANVVRNKLRAKYNLRSILMKYEK